MHRQLVALLDDPLRLVELREIEPRIGLAAQRGLWAAGYVVLVVMLALAAAFFVVSIGYAYACDRL